MRALAVYALLFSATTSFGQSGRRSFDFLQTPVSARMAALGGVNVSLADRDVNFFFANPALNGDTLEGTASASYQFNVGDIGHAGIAYAHEFKQAGMMTFGIQHMNLGTIQGYDAGGIQTGEFDASETALHVSRSHQVGNFRLGATLKGIFSNISGYRASAAALDLGGLFIHPRQQLTAGLVIRNAGLVLSDYSTPGNTRLPFDVQLGSSFKPQHMPLRFSVSAFHLTDKTLPGKDFDNTGTSGLEKVLSHMSFGSEILFHKNINMLVGYNYLSHRTLKLKEGGGSAGLALGFSATVKMIDFVASRTAFVAGNASYSFTLSGNINSYLKKRKL